jgi:hypothetical protein
MLRWILLSSAVMFMILLDYYSNKSYLLPR